MSVSRQTRSELALAITGLMGASAVFAFSVTGWLTQAELWGLLWPNDIHGNVVRMLGGTVTQNSVGASVTELGFGTVLLRALCLTCGLTFISWLRCRTSVKAVRDLLLPSLVQSCIVLLCSSAWWLILLAGELGFSAATNFASGVLPLWVCATAAIWLWTTARAWFPMSNADGPALRNEQDRRTKLPVVLLGACMVSWVAVSFWLNYCLYQQLFIPHGDSAMYEEHLWNVWHGKGFRSYLDQGLFLGEHFQVIHLLLLPLHMLWPSHLLLELSESVALASCSVPIYLIACRHTDNRLAAALLAIAWLFYFPMHFLDIAIDQKTFRPIALGLPFLFWLIELSERRKVVQAFVCLLIVLSAKEDMALVTFPLMAVMGFSAWKDSKSAANTFSEEERVSSRKAARWFGLLAAFSAVYVLAVVTVGIPAFRSGESVHYSRYFGDLGSSPGELVQTALTKPFRVTGRMFSVRTLLYGLIFLLPVALFPLRRCLYLAAASVSFTMLSLMELGDSASDLPPIPYHHFHAPLLPVIFWAAIAGIGKTTKDRAGAVTGFRRFLQFPRSPGAAAALILCCCIATSLIGSMMPCGLNFWSDQSAFGKNQLYTPTDKAQQQRAEMASVVVEQIPLTARVASTDFIHTRLTHCERSYDYSDYIRKVNDYRHGVPDDTEYIVIDTGHRYSTIRSAADVPELQADDSDWALLPDVTDGRFLILKRVR